MPRYKTYNTKPFRIQAVEFDGENFDEVVEFVGWHTVEPGWDIPNFVRAGTYVMWDDPEIVGEVWDYLHSTWVGVKAGQFIIRGSKAEYYPCDPEVFHDKYVEADGFIPLDPEYTVNVIINSCQDPERIAAEVLKRMREGNRGGRPPR